MRGGHFPGLPGGWSDADLRGVYRGCIFYGTDQPEAMLEDSSLQLQAYSVADIRSITAFLIEREIIIVPADSGTYHWREQKFRSVANAEDREQEQPDEGSNFGQHARSPSDESFNTNATPDKRAVASSPTLAPSSIAESPKIRHKKHRQRSPPMKEPAIPWTWNEVDHLIQLVERYGQERVVQAIHSDNGKDKEGGGINPYRSDRSIKMKLHALERDGLIRGSGALGEGGRERGGARG
jgi:hypothetical protein